MIELEPQDPSGPRCHLGKAKIPMPVTPAMLQQAAINEGVGKANSLGVCKLPSAAEYL